MEDQLKMYNDLLVLVENAKKDAEKFFVNNNKAAGTRVRADMKAIKDQAQEIRLEVSAIKKK